MIDFEGAEHERTQPAAPGPIVAGFEHTRRRFAAAAPYDHPRHGGVMCTRRSFYTFLIDDSKKSLEKDFIPRFSADGGPELVRDGAKQRGAVVDGDALELAFVALPAQRREAVKRRQRREVGRAKVRGVDLDRKQWVNPSDVVEDLGVVRHVAAGRIPNREPR